MLGRYREHLAERTADLGERLLAALKEIKSPLIREVRGKGLLIGMELNPGGPSARTLAEALLAEGVLTKDTHETVLRFAPPLVIQEEDLAAALDSIRRVIAAFTPQARAAA